MRAFQYNRATDIEGAIDAGSTAGVKFVAGGTTWSHTCALRIMFRDLSYTAWVGGISPSYTLPTSFQSPCPPLGSSLYAHPSRSIPRSSTGILC